MSAESAAIRPESAESSRPGAYNPVAVLKGEVQDAKLLLDFAVANGKAIGNELIGAVKHAENWLVSGEYEEHLPPSEERTTFEAAYRDLAQVMAPVTAATLRATSDGDEDGRRSRFLLLIPFGPRISVARLWSRQLWSYAVFAALIILFSENLARILEQFYPADRETLAAGRGWNLTGMIMQSIDPFAYGALGSIAYLLRSAHVYIYERSFDIRRTPEYNNRILLGMISGGAIKLFVSQVTTDDGTVLELSGAALAFIAGYNSDFLFTTIERVIAAILPKVGLESVRKQAPDRTAMMTVERLVTRYASAPADEKKIIERLVDRLTAPQPPEK